MGCKQSIPDVNLHPSPPPSGSSHQHHSNHHHHHRYQYHHLHDSNSIGTRNNNNNNNRKGGVLQHDSSSRQQHRRTNSNNIVVDASRTRHQRGNSNYYYYKNSNNDHDHTQGYNYYNHHRNISRQKTSRIPARTTSSAQPLSPPNKIKTTTLTPLVQQLQRYDNRSRTNPANPHRHHHHHRHRHDDRQSHYDDSFTATSTSIYTGSSSFCTASLTDARSGACGGGGNHHRYSNSNNSNNNNNSTPLMLSSTTMNSISLDAVHDSSTINSASHNYAIPTDSSTINTNTGAVTVNKNNNNNDNNSFIITHEDDNIFDYHPHHQHQKRRMRRRHDDDNRPSPLPSTINVVETQQQQSHHQHSMIMHDDRAIIRSESLERREHQNHHLYSVSSSISQGVEDKNDVKMTQLGRHDYPIFVEYAAQTKVVEEVTNNKKRMEGGMTRMDQEQDHTDENDDDDEEITCTTVIPRSFAGEERDAMFALYSGHGTDGDRCVRYCKDILPQQITKHVRRAREKKYQEEKQWQQEPSPSSTQPPPVGEDSSDPNTTTNEWPYLNTEEYKASCRKAFLDCNKMMHKDQQVDDMLSGTTVISALFHGNLISICHVGDCRAVLGHWISSSSNDDTTVNNHNTQNMGYEMKDRWSGHQPYHWPHLGISSQHYYQHHQYQQHYHHHPPRIDNHYYNPYYDHHRHDNNPIMSNQMSYPLPGSNSNNNMSSSSSSSSSNRGRIVAIPLSRDQTPYRMDERERVKRRGAAIMSIDQMEGEEEMHENWDGTIVTSQHGDQPRVWVRGEAYPGIPFTRSIGDVLAEEVGVTAEPEILVRKLTNNDHFLVIASDAVFQCLTNQEVIDMCIQSDTPEIACEKIVNAANDNRRWSEEHIQGDQNITTIVFFLSCQQPYEVGRTTPTTEDLISLANSTYGNKPIRKRTR